MKNNTPLPIKICPVGRSGSGKDTIAVLLNEVAKEMNGSEQGLNQLCSVTTRPRRFPGEATHVFVTEEEANKMTERVAETVIAGYQYFATIGQFEECDIYVIDPRGLDCVCKKAPNIPVCMVYVSASDETRLNRAKRRAADPELAEKVFAERHADEDAMFTEFEQLLTQGEETFKKVYPTVQFVKVVENNGDNTDSLKEVVKEILQMAQMVNA